MIAIVEDGQLQFVTSLDGHAGAVVVADPAPADWATAPYHVVDGALVVNLDLRRVAKRALINRARDAAQDGGCMTPSGPFDTSERSRGFITGSIKALEDAAAIGLSAEIEWTLASNEDVTLTLAQLRAAGLAVAAHVTAMQQRARVLKERIDAAETLDELEAITWTLGDPE